MKKMFLLLVLILSSPISDLRGQSTAEPAVPRPGMNKLLEGVYLRVETAVEAAQHVLHANDERREGQRLAALGRKDEAQVHFERAEQIVRSAADQNSSIGNDPFLQEYLRAVRADIGMLEDSSSRLDVAGVQTDDTFIQNVLVAHGLPASIAAVVAIESGGDVFALSPKGARGLWQFMPDTARRYGLRVDAQVDERVDGVKSTYAAARYLRDLYTRFRDWPLALAAYNAGENRLQSVMDRTGIREFHEMANRRLLPRETLDYVPAVLRLMSRTLPDSAAWR